VYQEKEGDQGEEKALKVPKHEIGWFWFFA
jgi:hypothetical protein